MNRTQWKLFAIFMTCIFLPFPFLPWHPQFMAWSRCCRVVLLSASTVGWMAVRGIRRSSVRHSGVPTVGSVIHARSSGYTNYVPSWEVDVRLPDGNTADSHDRLAPCHLHQAKLIVSTPNTRRSPFCAHPDTRLLSPRQPAPISWQRSSTACSPPSKPSSSSSASASPPASPSCRGRSSPAACSRSTAPASGSPTPASAPPASRSRYRVSRTFRQTAHVFTCPTTSATSTRRRSCRSCPALPSSCSSARSCASPCLAPPCASAASSLWTATATASPPSTPPKQLRRSSPTASACSSLSRAPAPAQAACSPSNAARFHLAQSTGAPIVPIALWGTESMMQKGSAAIHPGHRSHPLPARRLTSGLPPPQRPAPRRAQQHAGRAAAAHASRQQ